MHRVSSIKAWILVACMQSVLLAAAQPAVADSIEVKENVFSVELQHMSRGESRYGGLLSSENEMSGDEGVANAPTSNFLLSRTRLAINYKRDWLEAHITPQHSGVWGQEGKGSFNIFQSWVKLTSRQGLFAQLGRVALDYDDERIIGSDEWAMASSSHDVLRMGYEGHGHKAHVILAYNQNANVMSSGGSVYTNGAQPYKTMHTLWYHYNVPRFPLGASLLFMNIGMQHGSDSEKIRTWFQQLIGTYITFFPRKWFIEGSWYHQFGRNENGMKIDAWMASAKATFKPDAPFSVNAGFDYLSGDKYFAVPSQGAIGMTRHEVIKGFSTVYGSHHKFYGAMDFFYVSTYVFGFTPGLQKAYIGATYSPIKSLSLGASYHYLATATKLEDMKMTLGHEVELQARYSLSRDVRISAGFSMMKGTETMERLKRSSNNNQLRWGWLSVSVSPSIFSTKW